MYNIRIVMTYAFGLLFFKLTLLFFFIPSVPLLSNRHLLFCLSCNHFVFRDHKICVDDANIVTIFKRLFYSRPVRHGPGYREGRRQPSGLAEVSFLNYDNPLGWLT
jgi:hypothetical protein